MESQEITGHKQMIIIKLSFFNRYEKSRMWSVTLDCGRVADACARRYKSYRRASFIMQISAMLTITHLNRDADCD